MSQPDSQVPFVLLDDARVPASDRGEGAGDPADALYYSAPHAVFVAHRAEEVAATLAKAEAAQAEDGRELAGYIAYEAGLALEEKLVPRASARAGAGGPLVWLGLFDPPEKIASADVPAWLASHHENGSARRTAIGPMDPQLSPAGYIAAFERLREAIHAGDIYQANLTYALAGSYTGDPMAIYTGLRAGAQAGYGGIVFDGSHWLLSLSPELFVASDGKTVKAKPMKGTRPRSDDPARDREMAHELAHSVKDRAENLMIVDLMRNDLSRVAVPGSVRVDAPFAVESYPTVHQMVSSVRAEIAPDHTPVDLVRALFPCGSITGAPKIRAMEMIDDIERDARGPYCGAIGRIGADGSAAFNVAIRTLRLTPEENGRGSAVLGVGSAIVADSDPLAERRECEIKAGFARRPAPFVEKTRDNPDTDAPIGFPPACDLIETMAFDPQSGIALLELHLERMKKSAAALGFSFDRHAARNQIQALCFELDAPARLRLLVSSGGAMALETSPFPEPFSAPVRAIALPNPIDPSDWRLRHKTSDRGFYEDATAAARAADAFDAVLVRADGLVTEGGIANIFVPESEAEDAILLTPPLSLGLLPGVLRAYLFEKGRVRESELTPGDLADGFFFGNAVRGLFEAKLV